MNESTCRTDRHGNKYWENEEGELHRTDGPAIEFSNGSKFWYQNGKRHREDGPAVEYANGEKEFWVRGKCCITFKEFFDATPKENREAALFLIVEFKNV